MTPLKPRHRSWLLQTPIRWLEPSIRCDILPRDILGPSQRKTYIFMHLILILLLIKLRWVRWQSFKFACQKGHSCGYYLSWNSIIIKVIRCFMKELSELVLCSAPSVPQPVFTITEKAPTRAFSWLKVSTSTFTFKTLLIVRHYAKQTLTLQ